MTMIDIRGLKFGYEGSIDRVFDDVSFRIDTDWHLGLIGRNGRGKTTLLRILRGELSYEGNISGLVPFTSFPQEIGNNDELALDVVQKHCSMAQEWEIMKELNLMDVDASVLYRPFMSLSGGEKTKLMLVALFLDKVGFPLIDEPTNHLDMKGRESVAKYLKRQRGFILVSHDRSFLDACIDHVVAINKSTIDVEAGDFSSWWENYQRIEQSQIAANEQIKKDISRLKVSEEKAKQWSDNAESKKIGFDPRVTEKSIGRRPSQAAKAAKMMSHAKNIERRFDRKIEDKKGLLQNSERIDSLLIEGAAHHAQRLVDMKDVTLFYEDSQVFEPISFEINQGDRIAITGVNGCGKSTLLKFLMGVPIRSTGEVVMASRIVYSYVSQDTSTLSGSIREYSQERHIDEPRYKAILRKMGFTQENLSMRIEQLSEGQKKCVLLGASLCENANIYVWDEPLNYIDIFMRDSIEKLLVSSDITMIYVEHDKSFVESVATKEIELRRVFDAI